MEHPAIGMIKDKKKVEMINRFIMFSAEVDTACLINLIDGVSPISAVSV
jgi:hypothetical protein